MNVDALINGVITSPALLIAIITIALAAVVMSRIKQIERENFVRGAAVETTRDFYLAYEEVVQDPDLPQEIEAILTMMLAALTDQKLGRPLFDALVKVMGSKSQSARSPAWEALVRIEKQRPDLHSKASDAARLAISALILQNASETTGVVIQAEASKQSVLMRMMEALYRTNDRNGSNGPISAHC